MLPMLGSRSSLTDRGFREHMVNSVISGPVAIATRPVESGLDSGIGVEPSQVGGEP